MEYSSKTYGSTIDQLRKDRKMSRVDLVSGIMSERNYQRFTKGEVAISNEKLRKLIDKINFDISIFDAYVNSNASTDYSKLIEARSLAIMFKIKEANVVLATIDKDRLEYEYHKFLYSMVKILVSRSLNGNDTAEFYSNIESLINFPEILKYKSISITELNALVLLNKKYILKKSRIILDFLYENITNKRYITENNADYGINLCYSTLAKGFFKLEDYDLCLSICNEGIAEIKNKHIVTGFDNLLAYKSLALNKKNNRTSAIETAIQLYMYLYSFGTKEHRDLYQTHMESQLNIKYSDLVHTKRED